jgi:peptidoglycan/LPS O-acetylase OafA/YrhL
MLQRPQTLFLLVALVLSVLMLTGPFTAFGLEGQEWALKHSGLFNPAGEKNELATWPVTVYFAIVAVLTLGAMLSYMNRVRQMRLTIFLILLNAGMVGMMFFYTWMAGTRIDGSLRIYQWRFVIPLVSMVLLFLAFRGIRKDELLVKAYDRLR